MTLGALTTLYLDVIKQMGINKKELDNSAWFLMGFNSIKTPTIELNSHYTTLEELPRIVVFKVVYAVMDFKSYIV